MKAWYKEGTTVNLIAASNLSDVEARLKFVRYKLTGIFSKAEEFKSGNFTFFSHPDEYAEHKR